MTVDGESTIITVTGAHHSHKLVLTKTWAAELRLTKLSLASAIFNTRGNLSKLTLASVMERLR